MDSSPKREHDEFLRETFLVVWRQWQEKAHATAVQNGFWESQRDHAELIALIHSELSEALEAARNGNPPDDKLPDYRSVTVELADAVIRIMDYAESLDVNLANAIERKMAYNARRTFKHGKAF